ncbi:uncharacterized protein LOC119453877 isoform X9 [Dermacentor silvarum]|uniref:uncharacterized protein LOC119453877 isoform X9 n=1 Tax=Dermacentor silvarum TaxID=543639 RepID=UPI0021013DCD|nr:uncharacterized protein LOC119453877 isoform X9 [Dermacentor silvarum]
MERPTVKGLTNAMSLGESITAKTACHAPSEVVGQVEVGMQCSLPLADKSVGCSLKAWSVSRSMQTTEAVDQSSSTSGRHHDFSLTVKHKELQPNRHNHRDRCDYATTSLPALIILKRKHRGASSHGCNVKKSEGPAEEDDNDERGSSGSSAAKHEHNLRGANEPVPEDDNNTRASADDDSLLYAGDFA